MRLSSSGHDGSPRSGEFGSDVSPQRSESAPIFKPPSPQLHPHQRHHLLTSSYEGQLIANHHITRAAPLSTFLLSNNQRHDRFASLRDIKKCAATRTGRTSADTRRAGGRRDASQTSALLPTPPSTPVAAITTADAATCPAERCRNWEATATMTRSDPGVVVDALRLGGLVPSGKKAEVTVASTIHTTSTLLPSTPTATIAPFTLLSHLSSRSSAKASHTQNPKKTRSPMIGAATEPFSNVKA